MRLRALACSVAVALAVPSLVGCDRAEDQPVTNCAGIELGRAGAASIPLVGCAGSAPAPSRIPQFRLAIGESLELRGSSGHPMRSISANLTPDGVVRQDGAELVAEKVGLTHLFLPRTVVACGDRDMCEVAAIQVVARAS